MTITIKNEFLEVTADTLGAEIVSAKSTADGTEYIWFGAENYWERHAIVPFPICGRLFTGEYTFNGKSYVLGCHGFGPDSEFRGEKISDTKMIFTLTENEETLKVYPIRFKLEISYELIGNSVSSKCTVSSEKEGDTVIFGIGAHPGFNVPFIKGTDFSDYKLDFGDAGKLSKCILSETCFMSGKFEDYPLEDGRYINLDHHLFDNDAIFFKNSLGAVALMCGDKKITVKCASAKYWGLWHTTGSDAPFVCIEPWMSIPSTDGIVDDLTTKEEMISVKPGEKYDFEYNIEFDV